MAGERGGPAWSDGEGDAWSAADEDGEGDEGLDAASARAVRGVLGLLSASCALLRVVARGSGVAAEWQGRSAVRECWDGAVGAARRSGRTLDDLAAAAYPPHDAEEMALCTQDALAALRCMAGALSLDGAGAAGAGSERGLRTQLAHGMEAVEEAGHALLRDLQA